MTSGKASGENSLAAEVFAGLVDPAAQRAPVRADASVGRPRDPGIEERALRTALEVYSRLGWAGFSIGKVASWAHMGKSSLYLRWPTKEAMLLDAFNATDAFFQRRELELGDVPYVERISHIVESRMSTYFTPVGLAVIRLNLENQTVPEAVGTCGPNRRDGRFSAPANSSGWASTTATSAPRRTSSSSATPWRAG